MIKQDVLDAFIKLYGPVGGAQLHLTETWAHFKPGLVVSTKYTPPRTFTYRIITNLPRYDLEEFKQELLDSISDLHFDVETVFEW